MIAAMSPMYCRLVLAHAKPHHRLAHRVLQQDAIEHIGCIRLGVGCERAPCIEYRGAFAREIREVVVADIGGVVRGSFVDADDVLPPRFEFGGDHCGRRALAAAWQSFDDDQTGVHVM